MKRRVMVEYTEASPGVRAVYDDVMAVAGMTDAPNWIKALGTNENVLKGAWGNYKNVVLTGEVPLLLKQLILFVISYRRGNQYCSASHGYTAMHLDKTLSCEDLYSLARGQAYPNLPQAFKVAIDMVTSAALNPEQVEGPNFDFEGKLNAAGFSEHEIEELMAQADLGLMMNAIMSIWDIPPEQELPLSERALKADTMLGETERAELARYEAFLSLSSEMAGLTDPSQVAKLLASRLKYVSNAYSWRYLCLDVVGHAGGTLQPNAPAEYFTMEGAGARVHLGMLAPLELTPFEQQAWEAGRARFFDGAKLDERVEQLPPVFRNPEITQVYVHPLWWGGALEAIFFVSTRAEALDKFDIKFIALTAQFVHRKVSHMRTEQRMTDELVRTLEHLRRTQDDLIQAEKLSALGSMVAGVSHELNTPIANAVLMASALQEHLHSLDQMLGGGGLRRSDLLRWQGGAIEMGQLLERSVQRAASLVASFKQVAVDQTSERRRAFDLQDCVEDVLSSLRPGYKGTPWQLVNEVPRGIECDTFPGPLEQVLTNLIQNAVLHGFEGRDKGCITIAADNTDAHVHVSVTDDGVGMDTATLMHIFEPFFTTKLGKGGSGLGLAISYRIATTILAGDLRAISSPGSGARFLLTMPRRTPRKI